VADHVEIELPCEPRSPGRARRLLEPFRQHLGEPRFEDLRLLVSELVTEAIGALANARSERITVRAERDGERVRASVENGTGTFFLPSVAPSPGDAGWSVYLVQLVSDAWGLRRDRDSATVWLEVSPATPARR
jgi:hypothetical protein